MTIEPCEIVEPPPLTFWFSAEATLASPLTPKQVGERLQNALPRVVVPPHAGTLFRIERVYGGRVRDSTFSLQGPWGRHTGAKLSVRGTISSHLRGSLIHLTIYPAGSMMTLAPAWFSGILVPIIWWILDGAFSVGPLAIVLAFGILGLLSYLLGLIGVGRQTGYLVKHLQTLFAGVSDTKIPPRRREVPAAAVSATAPPAIAPAVDQTWSSRATLWMVGFFALGGIGSLVSCVGIPMIFISQVRRQHQTVERMVETRCSIVDSRIVEDRHPVTKTEQKGGRYEQVPTGEIRTLYRPEFFVRYEVAGQTYETWTYRLSGFAGYQSRGGAEQILERFAQDQEVPCWYDPGDPKTVVLDRNTGSWILLPFMVFVSMVFLVPSAGAFIVAIVLLRKLQRHSQGVDR